MYDITIVGAGPAGATLARLLDKKYKVLLIEKRNLKKPSTKLNKCCGGLLAPDAQKMMAKLGINLPKSVVVDPQIFAVRTIDLHNNLERYYQRFYFNMDREKFDCYLASLVPKHVDFKQKCTFQSFPKKRGKFEITFRQGRKTQKVLSKVLIGAHGATHLNQTKQTRYKEYAAIQEWVKIKKAPPYFSAIFDPTITDFYSWTIPKENFLLIGSAIPTSNKVHNTFETLKKKLKNYGFDFDKTVKKEATMIFRPTQTKQLFLGEKNLGYIGEAAGWISPSSAEGLSYAFKSASLMSRALNTNFNDFLSHYKTSTASLRKNIFLKNRKSIFMYNHFLRKIVMKSGIQSIH